MTNISDRRMTPYEIARSCVISPEYKTMENFAVDTWCECSTVSESIWRPSAERAQARTAAKWAVAAMRAIETSDENHVVMGAIWFCIREFEKFKAMEKARKEAEEAQ